MKISIPVDANLVIKKGGVQVITNEDFGPKSRGYPAFEKAGIGTDFVLKEQVVAELQNAGAGEDRLEFEI
jgi:hypothetical protein